MNQLDHKPRNQVEALIALSLVHQLGTQRIRLLLQSVDHPGEVFTLPKEQLKYVDGIGPRIAKSITEFDNWNAVDEMLNKTRGIGAKILSYYDDEYPPLLREIYDPPLLLWVRGNIHILDTPGIAVVGTRRATQYGKDMAAKFSKELVGEEFTIVSGLAYGVDAAAHKATVEAGGKTVAVLGSGVDVIYPSKHAELASDIVEAGGAVISEFPLGTPPDAGNFPERNRIVSGLTLGTLVIESGIKGGSMITAQSALTQNREVFVIPHSLKNRNGVGCNHLIKRSAGKLVQSVEDILEELPNYHFKKEERKADKRNSSSYYWENQQLNELGQAICSLLTAGVMHIDDISEKLEISSNQLLSHLLELEMMNCIRQTAGKNFELV